MLSFPPNTFEPTSTILPVLHCGAGWIALDKPSGVPLDEHPWHEGKTTLCGELRTRLSQGQASAQKLGIARPAAVILTDAEVSGVVLIADRESGASDAWRNAVGSEQLSFGFLLLVKKAAGVSVPDEFSCTLPVAAHFSESRALISHKTGKKSETRFVCAEKFGEYELWRAETTFPRLHQVRLHAQESGLPIAGDALYGGVPAITNSQFGRKGRLNKGEVRPLYAPPRIHLEKIRISESAPAGTAFEISASLPSGFSALLKKLRARP